MAKSTDQVRKAHRRLQEAAERRAALALKLSRGGKSARQIAEELDCGSTSRAQQLVAKGLRNEERERRAAGSSTT